MRWTKEEEAQAKQEYDSMMDAFSKSESFKHEWKGHWEDRVESAFGRTSVIKGDKKAYMRYWMSNIDIINDNNWNNIEDLYDGDF